MKQTGPIALDLPLACFAIMAIVVFSPVVLLGRMFFDKKDFEPGSAERPDVKPEAGHHYRTRGGQKAFVAYIGQQVDPGDRCIGWIGKTLCSWTEDGFYFADLIASENDLVALWDDHPTSFAVTASRLK